MIVAKPSIFASTARALFDRATHSGVKLALKINAITTLEVRLDNVIGMTERQVRQAEMHEFIWKSWRERKCATLHLKSISKEGKETDADYEIRPLPGTLIMVVTINRARYGYQGQVFWHQDGKYDVLHGGAS